MKRHPGKILVLILVLFSCTYLKAQDTSITIRVDTVKIQKTKIITIVKVKTIPKFILHFNAGLNTGAMELTSHNGGFSRNDFTSGKNFAARNGFGFSLIGKLPLNKKGNFWLDIVSGFDRFQSDIFAKNTEEGKVSYNSINGGVGLEYNITPTHNVKYYFGANPLLSFISGKAEITNPDNNRVDITIKNSMRIGYQAFFGLEYAIEKNFGLNLGIKFTHANLLLKKSETPEQDEVSDPPTSIVGLNDDATTEPVEFAGWKQFAYFNLNFGFSYFFGVKEMKYKVPER
jgi:opacity protein-like surface antigen